MAINSMSHAQFYAFSYHMQSKVERIGYQCFMIHLSNTKTVEKYQSIYCDWVTSTYLPPLLQIVAWCWNNYVLFLITRRGTHFNETLIENQMFSYNTLHLKLFGGHFRAQCINEFSIWEYPSTLFVQYPSTVVFGKGDRNISQFSGYSIDIFNVIVDKLNFR